ncbi:MAG: trigger factor [Candidatus Zhuqueibacterota bacterium]
MEINVVDQGQWEKVIDVTVPYSELLPKIESSYQDYKKSIQLEGFRKGKVPLDLIKKIFGAKIEKETAESSIQDFLKQAIQDKAIKVYDIVKIDPVDFNQETGLHFGATVQLEPEVNLVQFKNLEIEKENYLVTDDDVDAVLKDIQEEHAVMNDVKTEAMKGHFIVADLQQTDASGIPLVGRKFENRYLRLLDENNENAITEQLVGVKIGDTRQIRVPSSKGEEGPTAEEYFAVTVKEIKEKILPEIDDQLAKASGQFESLDVMKKDIRENLVRQFEVRAMQQVNNSIRDKIVKTNPIDLPDYMIENFLTGFVEDLKKDNRTKMDDQDLREQYRADAIWNLKWLLFRDKIMEAENIHIDDAEVDNYIESFALKAGREAAMVRSNFRKAETRKRLKQDLLEKKIIDFLRDNARITEKTITLKESEKASDIIV